MILAEKLFSRANMKMLLINLFILLSQNTFGQEEFLATPDKCGEYKISGMVQIVDDDIVIVVHAKSKSQIILSVPLTQQVAIGHYLFRDFSINALLNEKFDGTYGKIATFTGPGELRVPDPLNPKDTGFQLIKEQSCKKN